MKKAIQALALSTISTISFAAAPSFTVTDLGTLSWASPHPQPGSLPGTTEYDAKSYGEVGSDVINDPNFGPMVHAYLYKNGDLKDLGTLPGAMRPAGAPMSIGRGLNTAAHVVGTSDSAYYHSVSTTGDSATHAVLWNGATLDLGTLSGDPGYSSVAQGVNDSDEVVGHSEVTLNTGQLAQRAFVWISGKMYNLTSYIAARYPNVRLTDALAINCQGSISAVGYDVRSPNVQRSYLLTRIGISRPSCQ